VKRKDLLFSGLVLLAALVTYVPVLARLYPERLEMRFDAPDPQDGVVTVHINGTTYFERVGEVCALYYTNGELAREFNTKTLCVPPIPVWRAR
jgi:hypothetical protein